MTDATDQARGEASFGALDSVVHAVGSTAQLALTVGQPALSVLQVVVQIASLFGIAAVSAIPGVGPILAILIPVLTQALPILAKVASYAPVAQKALQDNEPVIETVLAQAPDLRGWLQELYAMAANADPLHLGVTPAQVTDAMLSEFVNVARNSQFTPQDPRFDRLNVIG